MMSQMLRHLKRSSLKQLTNSGSRSYYSSNSPIHEVKAHSPHPWPEWTAFSDKLFKNGFFGTTRPTSLDIDLIKNASINFARLRYDLIRYLSAKHIFVLVESGCPSTDEKIVNSGKRLRAHFNIDELNVCGSCILSGNCERAFLRAPKGEGGTTVDVMRFLLQYGLDPLTGSVDSVPHLNKNVRESAKILLKEVVEFSGEKVSSQLLEAASSESKLPVQESSQDQTVALTRQSDWICPKCNFLNFARNIRCLRCDHLSEEKLKQLRADEENLPLRKGDWKCEMCYFLNFAKNSLCLRCKSKPPKRHLILGEWECESCYYINFRKNRLCLKCDNRRPMGKTQVSESSKPASYHIGYQHLSPVFGESKHSEDGHTMSNFTRTENNTNEKFNSGNQIPVLVDFPVLGGKSNLSRDVHIQERWKREIKSRRENVKRDGKNADDSECSILKKDGKP